MLFAVPEAADAVVLPRPVSAATTTQNHRYRTGPWELTVRRDRFTGKLECSLRAGRMAVVHGAVRFRFSSRLDTFDAQYRLDSGPVRPWRVNIMTLAADGLSLGTDDPRNPSGGVVTIPVTALDDVRKVWIRPRTHGAPTAFLIDRLPMALTVAERQGCGADIFGADAG